MVDKLKRIIELAKRTPLKYKTEPVKIIEMKYTSFDKLPSSEVKKILDYYKVPVELTPEFEKRDFNTISRLSHIISQLKHESGNFTRMEENLNYSAKRLRQVFPTRVKTDAYAQELAHNPEKIGNAIYGGRYGNTSDGDGFKYRGRGALMITFKDNYREAEKDTGIPFVSHPELMSTMGKGMIASLNWLSKRKVNNLIEKAPSNIEAIKSVTKLINGGYNGLNHRESLFYQTLGEIRNIVG